MNRVVTVTIDLRVDDLRRFIRKARKQAIAEGAAADMKEAAQEYNVWNLPACAQMILDPGTMDHATILQSESDWIAPLY